MKQIRSAATKLVRIEPVPDRGQTIIERHFHHYTVEERHHHYAPRWSISNEFVRVVAVVALIIVAAAALTVLAANFTETMILFCMVLISGKIIFELLIMARIIR